MREDQIEQIDLKEVFSVIFRRKKILALVTILTILIGYLVTIALPEKLYQSEITMDVSDSDSTLNISTTNDGTIQNMLNEIIKPLDINFEGYVKNILADEVLEKTIADLELGDKYTVDTLRNKLKLTENPEEKIITVSFSSKEQKEPVNVLNTLSENFMEYSTEKAKVTTKETLEKVKDQTNIEKEKYENALENYENFIAENKSIEDYQLEKDSILKRILDLKSSLSALEVKEQGLRGAIEENNKYPKDSVDSVLRSSIAGTVFIGDARKAFNIELAEVMAAKETTEELISNLNEDIKKANIDYKKAEIEQTSINQLLEISKDSYQSFAKTYETLETIGSFDTGKLGISITSMPEEAKATQSNTKLSLIIFTAMGLVLGVIAAFIKEYIEYRKTKKGTIEL